MSEKRRTDNGCGEPTHPPRQIIVHMEDPSTDNDVVSWAARVARADNSDLVVVRSWIPLLGELRSLAQRAATARLLAEMRSWARPAEDLGVSVRFQVLQGDDAEALCRFAEQQSAHLVVVRCDRRRTWFAVDSGTLLHRIARCSRSPLAIVPPGGSAHGLRHLLVALNESASSRAAAEWVARTAPSHQADVHAVAVFEPVVEWVPSDDPRSVWQLLRHQLEGSWTAPLTAAGVPSSTEVIEGARVVDAVTHYARQHHLDAIVVGAGDHPGSLHSGSMAIHLVQHSGLPVIVVPPQHNQAERAQPDRSRAGLGAS